MMTQHTTFRAGFWKIEMERGGVTVKRESEDREAARVACIEYLNKKLEGIYVPLKYYADYSNEY